MDAGTNTAALYLVEDAGNPANAEKKHGMDQVGQKLQI